MKQKNITKICTLLLFLSLSFIIPSFSLAIDLGFTNTDLNWDISDETYNEEWEWQDSSWEFGPRAKFRVEYTNGTEINSNAVLNVDEEFIIRAYIPETIFRANLNRSLGAVEIHWHMDEFEDQVSNDNYNNYPILTSDLNLMYYAVHPSQIWDWFYEPIEEPIYEEGWEWEVQSWQENNTLGEGFEGEPFNTADEQESLPTRLKLATEEPEEWEEPEGFFDLFWDQCEIIYNDLAQSWEIKWAGKFNERVYLGTYRVDMSLYSNYGERINMWGFNSWDYETAENPEKWIGVGKPVSYNNWWGYNGKWGVKTLDASGVETNIVSIEDPITFRYNISNSIIPGKAYVKLNLPNGYTNISIIEGWYEEKISHMGGWIYDNELETYIYNPNINFTTSQQTYGFYEQKTWIDCWSDNSQMINRSGWDWSTNTPVWVENLWQEWVSNQLFIMYDESSGNVSLKIGYEYWGENPNDPYEGGESIFVLRDVNASNKIENFFKLYGFDIYTDNYDYTIIEMSGYFTNLLAATESQFWYDTRLIDVDGNEHWNDGMSNGQIGINQPQANTYILDGSNIKYDKPFYNIKAGESFMIQNRLDGSNEFWNSIDGIGFRLNCWESEWTPDMDKWTEIEIYVTYDFNTKETKFEAYNRTTMRLWENSSYQDWIAVEKEDWHWEYDEILGKDDWVYGTYTSWDWAEVVDFHWQEYQFNQETKEWVKGWLPWRGKEVAIPSDIEYLIINDVSRYTNSLGSFIDLNITILEGAPEASYNWEVDFLKEVWGYDYEKPWDKYDCLQWVQQDVYYYKVGIEKIFLQEPQMEDFVVINDNSYLIKEIPYIEIAGEFRPLKINLHKEWNGEIYEVMMYYEWDWQTGQEYFYYEDAATEEKIIFYESEKVNIYNVTLHNSENDNNFLTYMNRPSQYWDDMVHESVYYFVDIYGDLHYSSGYTQWNETGGDHIYDYGNLNDYWIAENIQLRTIHNVEQLIISDATREYENRVYFVVLDGTSRLEISTQGIQWFNGEKYIVGIDGTKYAVTESSEWSEEYGTNHKVVIDGVEHYLSDYMEAYKVNYSDCEILVPIHSNGYHHNWDKNIKSYFYTIVDGEKYNLPYSGANVNDRWEMEAPVTGLLQGSYKHYGIIPVLRFVDIEGNLYLLDNLTFNDLEPIKGDIIIGDEVFNNLEIFKGLATTINGTPNFDLYVIGESIPYGESFYNYPFRKEGTLKALPNQRLAISKWDLEYLGIDNFYAKNGSYFLSLIDGTRRDVKLNYYIPLFNLTIKIHDYTTGQDKIWKKGIISTSCWEYWNQSKRFIVQLNGSLLEIPDQAWIEHVEEYKAKLTFINENTEFHLNLYNKTGDFHYTYLINWTEPDFWSQEGQDSINFTFRGEHYFYEDFTFYNEWGHMENALQNNILSVLEVEISSGEWKTIMNPNYDWNTLEAIGWQTIYNFTINSEDYNAYMEEDFIQLSQTVWGHPYGQFLQRQDVLQVRDTWNLIFGSPTENMWGYRMFSITDEGALDLDGDFSTTDDQYYVYRIYESKDSFSHTRNVLELEINYDPLTSVPGNEMHMYSSLGINFMNWTYEWTESFTWFKADGTFLQVNPSEMNEIKEIVLDDNGYGKPGYWEIEHMVYNRTWEDVLLEAEKYNWDWVLNNHHEWTWIEFNINQDYWADFYADSSMTEIKSAFITNRYEYAGLMLYLDADNDGFMDIGFNSEITHFFVPSTVENVTFILPNTQMADDYYQETREYWGPNGMESKQVDVYSFYDATVIDWGIKFSNVNGTTYPYYGSNKRSMWDWYDEVVDGADFRGFSDKPVKVTIDKLEFMIHFNADNNGNELYYSPNIKIDQRVGDWTPHCVGGMQNLENYSLSLTYYALSGVGTTNYYNDNEDDYYPKTSGGASNETIQVIDDNNQTVSNDNQTISESFSMVIENKDSIFAKTELGSPYTWSFNTSKNLQVAVFSTPISTFSGAFMKDNQKSCTSFNFDAELFFMSVGFPIWDGYEVYNDPCFTAYVGANAHDIDGLISGEFLTIIIISGGSLSCIVIVVVVIRAKKKKNK